MRSWLFVPGDSERKIAKSEGVAADVVILDLEDSVALANKDAGRRLVAEYLAGRGERAARLFVRINPLDSGLSAADLAAVMPGRPDGIMLPKCRSAVDVAALGVDLDALEAEHGVAAGATMVVAIATEVPEALFALGGYAAAGPRLEALTWGAEDLAAAVGALANKDESGNWSAPFQLARSLCLFGAAAAGVVAIDTLHADFRDEAGLIASARQARRDGFLGKLAIHPDQVDPINAAFTPSAEERARAEAIVALFAADPGAGVLSLDGQMLDRPHLVQAQHILARRS
jgi:citrate lyase subunit beta/citryl-CoA lyase